MLLRIVIVLVAIPLLYGLWAFLSEIVCPPADTDSYYE